MKSRSSSFLSLFSIVAITFVQTAAAETRTWVGPVDGIWDTTATNWSGVAGTPWDNANGPSNTAVFNTPSLAAVASGPVDTNGITFSITGALSGSTINLAGTTPAIAVATGQAGTISSTVAGSNGLIKSSAGLLTLSAATYTGGTTVSAGRLVLENNKTGSSTFLTNADLEFNLTSGTQQLNGGTISGTGKFIKSGGSTLMLGANGSPQAVSLASGALIDVQGGTLRNEYGNSAWGLNLADLNVATGATFDIWDGNTRVDAVNGTGTIRKGWTSTNSITIGVDNGSGNFNGTINSVGGGAFSLIKEGTGTQTLSGSIGHSGGTTVNGGKLVLLNTTPGSSNFTTNAVLEIQVTSGDQTLAGNGTINGSGNFIKTGAGDLRLGFWYGPQAIALTGASSIIDIQQGSVFQDYGNSAWGDNKAGMNIASGANFTVGSGSASVDELTGSGRIGADQGGTCALTVGVNNGTGTFSGEIPQFGNGQLSLLKQGSGTQTLSGSQIYFKGGVTVSSGRLVLQGNTAGVSNFTTNAELEFNVTTGNQQLANGTISGTGNLIKSGTGELWFGAGGQPQTVALTGANSIIDVQGGVLRNEYFNSAWDGNKAGLTIAGGAVFDLWDGNATMDELNGSGIIQKGQGGTHTLTIGVNDGTGSFSGAISNPSGTLFLVKQGAGTQTLTGANTYDGVTTVTAGTLALVGGSQASLITVSSGASLGFTIDSPTTSTNSFDFIAGSTVTITGTPVATTLITDSTGITGTPVLSPPIPGFSLMVDGNSLKLVGSGPSGYASWITTPAFGLTVGQRGAASDPDNDSMNNLLEYALNGNPSISDLAISPTLLVTPTHFVFTYSRLDLSIADTVQIFEYGSNLAGWTPVVIPEGPGTSTAGEATVTIANTGATDSVEVRIPRSLNAGGNLFGRLKVSQ